MVVKFADQIVCGEIVDQLLATIPQMEVTNAKLKQKQSLS